MLDELSKKRVKELCNRIASEQDHNQFSILIDELNQLLDPDLRDAKKTLSRSAKENVEPECRSIPPQK